MPDESESIEELRNSFFYGSRSNLDFKFAANLSDTAYGQFLSDLFSALGDTINSGDASEAIEAINRWQVEAYAGQHPGPDNFPHVYEPMAPVAIRKPLSECRVALVTSSGHFVAGNDPEPFGVKGMTQEESEARIHDFLRETPTLSPIPITASPSDLRVRHPGYPTAAAVADHQVNLPLGHLWDLEKDATIGTFHPTAYSFVGAASQLRLKKRVAPEWGEMLREQEVDLVLLVPV